MDKWRHRIWRFGVIIGAMRLLASTVTACEQAEPAPAASATPRPAITTLAPAPTATVRPSPTAVPTVPCHASKPGVSAAREAAEYLTAYDHILGDKQNGSVFLVVYSDFQCVPCAQLAPVLRQVQAAHSQDVVLVFRHYPLLNVHDKAALAAQAAEAAARQGKFWEMHDLLFAEQSRWTGLDDAAFQNYLRQAARTLELDEARFMQDLTSDEIQAMVQQAWENGLSHNLPAVPMLYINTQLYTGPLDFAAVDTVARLDILSERQFHTCPPMTVPPDAQVAATLNTTRGKIVLRLFPDKAPHAVNSFVFLAEQGWYDHNLVMRDAADRWVRSGDPSGTGYGNAGYTFGLELAADLRFDRVGQVALYSAGGDTNSSQFFITLQAVPALDGHATIFGSVEEGMDVVRSLTSGDHILSVSIRREP